MPLRHRRSLFSDRPYYHGDCDDLSKHGCSSPPSPTPPPPHSLAPSPSPSPSPSSSPSPSPFSGYDPWTFTTPHIPCSVPSPSPAHAGRRDQGRTHAYVPAPTGVAADDHHRRFVTYILIAAAALAFVSLILLGVSVAVRRRRLRRRRQALLAPAPAAATNVVGGGNDDPEGGGGVVHHVWYIRTVGLDEVAINSIPVARYRDGVGLLGASDCSVCLGEFNDGELLRLLPKCGHVFHVPCIDTWLRAHVNCPVCRSDVLDPTGTAAGDGTESNSNSTLDPDANDNAAADQAADASDSTLEDEEEENEQEAPRVVEDQREQQLSSPEPLPRRPCLLPWNVRRAASMDAATVSVAADVAALARLPMPEEAPEGEQSGRDKHRRATDPKVTIPSGSGDLSNLSTERPPASGAGAPRSFFSLHCRARSSVLPL